MLALLSAGAMALAAPAAAGDYNEGYHAPSLGGCYVRGDVGYSFAKTPNLDNYVRPDEAAVDPNDNDNQYYIYPDGDITNEDLDDGWFAEAGFGCGHMRYSAGGYKDAAPTPGLGYRGELTIGYRSERDLYGEPPSPILMTRPTPVVPVPPPPAVVVDPLFSDLSTTTVMANVFVDIPTEMGFTPYVGAGIGGAYHDLGQTRIVNGGTVTFDPDGEWELAWSLMAGVGVPVSESTTLDFGYRYIDMGELDVSDAASGISYTVDDLTAHEIKAGLRIKLN